MAARRDKTPPYELMRSLHRPPPESAAPAPSPDRGPDSPQEYATGEPEVFADAPSADFGSGIDAAWWARFWTWAGVGVPIVLRVPRGLAMLAAVGFVCLLMLAYWAGHTRGGIAVAENLREQLRENPALVHGRSAPAPPVVSGSTGATATASGDEGATAAAGSAVREPSGQGRVMEAGTEDDPRVAGLNYMIVATYLADDARDLAEFLTGHGVDTVLHSVNNGRRVQVWVVDQGFSGSELGGDAYNAYLAELRDLGRAWRRHRPGLRDSLEKMYPVRYDAR